MKFLELLRLFKTVSDSVSSFKMGKIVAFNEALRRRNPKR